MKLLAIISAILFVAGICLITVAPTWYLWNWLMPSIFSVREISLSETFGLMILFRLLCSSPQ